MLRSNAAGQSGVVQGPDFQAWDLKFGLIMNESGEWDGEAEKNGTLGNRQPSCRVYEETTSLTFPLPPEPPGPGLSPDIAAWFHMPDARYGLTFEYTTTKANVPYTLVITYPPSPDYPQGGPRKSVNNGWLPGETTGKRGRYCFYQWGNSPDGQIPGTRCYQVTIEGVPLPEICVAIVNPNPKFQPWEPPPNAP